MKPKSNDISNPGLLEYLEDIIGSNQYKQKIESLEEEYTQLVDMQADRQERVRINEEDLEKLDDSKNTAIEYVRKEKECFQLRNVSLQIHRNIANKEIMEIEEKFNIQKANLAQEKKNYKEKMKENNEKLKQYELTRK